MDVAVPFYPCLHLSVRPLVRASLVILSFQCSVLLPFPVFCPAVREFFSSFVLLSIRPFFPLPVRPFVRMSFPSVLQSFNPFLRPSKKTANFYGIPQGTHQRSCFSFHQKTNK